MKRKLLLLALLFLAFACGCGLRGQPEPLTIGHILTTSDDSSANEQARHGAALAFEHSSWRLKDLRRPVVIREVISATDADAISANVVRLVRINRAFALIGGPDDHASATLEHATRGYGLPLILTSGDAAVSTSKTTWSLVTASPYLRGRALARFALQQAQHREVAIVVDGRDNDSRSLAAAFEDFLRGKPGASCKRREADSDAECEERTRQAVAEKCDLLLLAAPPSCFAKCAAQVNMPTPIIYGGADIGVPPLRMGIELQRPYHSATVYFSTEQSMLDFAQRYRERFQSEPGLPALQAYDAVSLLAEAIEQAHSTQADKLCDCFEKPGSFVSATGPVAWKNHAAVRPIVVVEVSKGESRLALSFDSLP